MKARRVCAQCGKTEGWWRMFKIWKGTSHDVDLCSFECSGAYYRDQRKARISRPSGFPPDVVEVAVDHLEVLGRSGDGHRPAAARRSSGRG